MKEGRLRMLGYPRQHHGQACALGEATAGVSRGSCVTASDCTGRRNRDV